MTSSRAQLIVQTLSNGASSIALQAVALLTLTPTEYGQFSLLFIGYAWFISLMYSIIAEPWLRQRRNGHTAAWDDYSAVSVVLATLAAVPAIVIGAVLNEMSVAVLMAAATAFGVYRVASRFHEVVAGSHRRVWIPDAVGTAALVICWIGASRLVDPLDAVAICWLAGALTAAITSRLPQSLSVRRTPRWLRRYAASIRPLLADSILQDASTVALPLFLAPLLGLGSFGVYRALASAALPVRLVLLPLRPSIGMRPLTFFARFRALCLASAASLAVAIVTAGVLAILTWAILDPHSTLGTLASTYIWAVGAFVLFYAVGTLYYFVARAHLRGRVLLAVRLEQLAGAIAGPIIGYAINGLDGVIWGSVLVTALHAIVLVATTFVSSTRATSAGASSGT